MLKNKRRMLFAVIAVLLLGGAVLSILLVNQRAAAMARNRAYDVLFDSAMEQATELNAMLNAQFETLEALATGLTAQQKLDESEILTLLKTAEARSLLPAIRFIRTDGTDLMDKEKSIADSPYFQRALAGERSMAHIAQLSNGEASLALAVPCWRGGQVQGVVVGLYYQEYLQDFILSTVYAGNGYSFVVDAQGNVMISANSPFYLLKGKNNLLSLLTDAAFENGFTVAELASCLQSRQSGSFSFAYGEERRTMVFVPLTGEHILADDWFLFKAVPQLALQQEMAKERASVWELSLILLLFVGLAVVIFFQRERVRRREIRQEAVRARMQEERFGMVLRATGTLVFVYDVQTKTYEADPGASEHIAASFDGRPVKTMALEEDLAQPEEIKRALAELGKVIAGESRYEETTLRLKTPGGERHWFRIQAIRFENEGTPKVLVTANDVNARKTAEDGLLYRAERDLLTGLYNRITFYEKGAELVAQQPPASYVLTCFDVDNFKVINDQYGYEAGDQVLRHIARAADECFGSMGGICCRVYADNFVAIYPNAPENDAAVTQMRLTVSQTNASGQSFHFSVGRYVIEDLSLPVSVMHDRAIMAKASIKGRYGLNVAYYSNDMRDSILREQAIIREMDSALKSGQFQVWFQPQYNLSSGAAIGAEALVRWQHPEKGMISPGVFIPIFERNGFVYQLDQFVWEQVCLNLRRWLDQGLSPLPVSVNVSRHDMFHDDFFAFITGLVEQYDLPVDLLRLEITESAFSASAGRIVEIIKQLRKYGFIIEIDDFGSGYSSLNTLKDVPADILKLDMRFLSGGDDEQRGGSIVSSVIRMAKWLNMPVIAEGVETWPQAAFLGSVGCAYVQGYLYARPMPLAEYERSWQQEETEQGLLAMETIDTLDNNAFWDPDSMDTLVFNRYVGGACVLEYQNRTAEILRINQKYLEEIGLQVRVGEVLAMNLRQYMNESDYDSLMDTIERAIAGGKEEEVECGLQNLSSGEAVYLRVMVRQIARSGDRHMIYAAIENITARWAAEQNLKETKAQMESIMDNMSSGVCATAIEDGKLQRIIVFANDRYYALMGYSREQFAREVEDLYQLIHEEDRDRVREITDGVLLTGVANTYEYRCMRRDGSIVWVSCNSSAANVSGITQPVLLAVITDVSAERKIQRLREELLNNLPCGAGIFEFTGKQKINVIHLNQAYLDMIGREAMQNCYKAVHPVDGPALLAELESAVRDRRDISIDIRILHGSSVYIPVHLVGRIADRSREGIIAYITCTKIKKEHFSIKEMLPVVLASMMKSAPELAFVKDKRLIYVCATRTFANMVGFEDERDIVGKTDYDLFPKALADAYVADDRRLLESGVSLTSHIEPIPSQDGSERYSTTSKYVLHDDAGNIAGIYGVGRDVTDWREQHLFGMRQLFEEAFEGDPVTDRQIIIRTTVLQEPAESLEKLPLSGLIKLYAAHYVHPADVARFREALSPTVLRAACGDGPREFGCAFRILLPEGGYAEAEAFGSAIFPGAPIEIRVICGIKIKRKQPQEDETF